MTRPTVTAPPELTLPVVAELLEQFRAAPAGLHLDLRATTSIDLAALQLLLATAREGRLLLTQAANLPLESVCRAAGIDPAIFHPSST
ncbi:MAG: STAS domain-containing protein [Acidobacteria bacterium]|nr:STAS domain-containing protein [Acidobacteriota bacterium]